MKTQILVPLDGSNLAEQALPCATMLAQGLPAELVLFRAVSLPAEVKDILVRSDRDADASAEPLQVQAQEYLNKTAERLRETGADVATVIRSGPAAEAIVDFSEQPNDHQITTIVMATHGYSGISRWIHGSVAERVLLTARVPVLLVRAQDPDIIQHASYKPIACRRILVPLDGSPVAEQVLPSATSIAQAIDAEIVLLRVLAAYPMLSLMGEGYFPMEDVIEIAHQEAEPYLKHVADRLAKQGVRTSTAIQAGGVANAIIDHAEANGIDLIAMCTHGRTGLARWAMGSVADRVLRAGRTPLLLVRARY